MFEIYFVFKDLFNSHFQMPHKKSLCLGSSEKDISDGLIINHYS